jgi:hypothetical protein
MLFKGISDEPIDALLKLATISQRDPFHDLLNSISNDQDSVIIFKLIDSQCIENFYYNEKIILSGVETIAIMRIMELFGFTPISHKNIISIPFYFFSYVFLHSSNMLVVHNMIPSISKTYLKIKGILLNISLDESPDLVDIYYMPKIMNSENKTELSIYLLKHRFEELGIALGDLLMLDAILMQLFISKNINEIKCKYGKKEISVTTFGERIYSLSEEKIEMSDSLYSNLVKAKDIRNSIAHCTQTTNRINENYLLTLQLIEEFTNSIEIEYKLPIGNSRRFNAACKKIISEISEKHGVELDFYNNSNLGDGLPDKYLDLF